MLILTLRTDKPEAEIGLYENDQQLSYQTWAAHRQLAETINTKIIEVLQAQSTYLHDLGGILAYQGPGSFTGLRIGLSVANALSYSLQIPVIASQSDDWRRDGLAQLLAAKNHTIVVPEYGAEPHITAPRH